MAIFSKKKKHHHHHPHSNSSKEHQSPPVYQPSTTIPIPFTPPPQQSSSYFPPQSPPPSFSYGQSASQSSWVLTPPSYQPYQVTVSQTYLVPSQSPPQMSSAEAGCPHLAKLKNGAITVTNLLQGDVPEYIPGARAFNSAHYLPVWQQHESDHYPQSAPIYDIIASKLDAVVTLIDGERFSGDERELTVHEPPASPPIERSIIPSGKGKSHEKTNGGAGCPLTTAITSTNYFAKVNLYQNSKLPWDLPPMKL